MLHRVTLVVGHFFFYYWYSLDVKFRKKSDDRVFDKGRKKRDKYKESWFQIKCDFILFLQQANNCVKNKNLSTCFMTFIKIY